MISSGDGQPPIIRFASGLADFQFVTETEPFTIGDAAPFVDVEVLFDSEGTAWHDFVANVQIAVFGTGEIALIRVGDEWEDREIIISGDVSNLEHDGAWEPVGFSVGTDFSRDQLTIPPAEAILSEATVGVDHDPALTGQPYPAVIGNPGSVRDDDPAAIQTAAGVLTVAGSPALKLDGNDLIICGFPTQAGEINADVNIRNVTANTSVAATAAHRLDDLGRIYTFVPVVVADGDEVWCRWREDNDAGGIVLDDASVALRGLGDFIVFLFQNSTSRFDRSGSKAAIDALNAYELDYAWNTQRSAFDIIAEDLAPYFPMGLEAGPAGLRLIHWNLWADDSDVVFEVNPRTRGGARLSGVRTSGIDEVVNEVTVRFWNNPRSGFLRATTLGADRQRISKVDPEYHVHPFAVASQSAIGSGLPSEALRPEVYEVEAISQNKTAAAVAEYLLRRDAIPHKIVSYTLPLEYQSIRNGAIGRLTDDEVGLTDELVMAFNVRKSTLDTQIDFRTIPDPARGFHP